MNTKTTKTSAIDVSNLKVISMNVRGLRNLRKRRTLFYTFKKEKYDIICLQETYLTKSDLPVIEKEWPHIIHLAEGSIRSKGLITLFSKKIPEANIVIKSINERCLISQVILQNLEVNIFMHLALPLQKFSFLTF